MRRPPAEDVAWTAAFDELARLLWHRLPDAYSNTDDVLLATRGFDLELAERCPALDDENHCSLQGPTKPAVCRVVPLDALIPDREQHRILRSRRDDAQNFGSDCIQPGARPGFTLVTRRLEVVDGAARAAVAAHREQLAFEKRAWGDAVFELLRTDLFAGPTALDRVPAAGFMTLPIAPVLMVLARDAALRLRSVRYLAAQARLAERLLDEARSTGRSGLTRVQQLSAFARSNAALAARLRN